MRRSLYWTARAGSGREPGERADDERLELLARDAVTRQAEVGVGDRDGALRLGNRRERAAGGDVLRDEASAEHDRERARCRRRRRARAAGHGRAGAADATTRARAETRPSGSSSLPGNAARERASPPLNLLVVD